MKKVWQPSPCIKIGHSLLTYRFSLWFFLLVVTLLLNLHIIFLLFFIFFSFLFFFFFFLLFFLVIGSFILLLIIFLFCSFFLNRFLNRFYFAGPQIDGEVDELAVLLDQLTDGIRFQVVSGFFFEVKAVIFKI